MRNKWPDFRRLIEIGVNAPQVLDPTLLEDGPATRQFLRQACLEAPATLDGNRSGVVNRRVSSSPIAHALQLASDRSRFGSPLPLLSALSTGFRIRLAFPA